MRHQTWIKSKQLSVVVIVTVFICCLIKLGYYFSNHNLWDGYILREHLNNCDQLSCENKNQSLLNNLFVNPFKTKQLEKTTIKDSSISTFINGRLSLVGCVQKTDPIFSKTTKTIQLKFDLTDCALFCIGRNFSHANLNLIEKDSRCFCSYELPAESYKKCTQNSSDEEYFKSYKLNPVKIPAMKVREKLLMYNSNSL